LGSVEHPVSAAAFAFGAGARFVARTVDTLQEHVPEVLASAHAHRGTSFVEILQNCIVYNDGVYGVFTDREVAADAQIHVKHGQPLSFGEDGRRGLRVKPGTLSLEAVTIGEDGIGEADLAVHDQTDRILAALLAALKPPMPVALGILYCDPAPVYEAEVRSQIDEARAKTASGGIAALLHGGRTWEIEGRTST
jgi:2-oxoglutarate ferredoxin oxidoreductase subunit beta